MSRGVRVARWLAAVIMIAYGFAKLTGSQFTVLDSELTRPMGEVSGFWLTWYYFGFSSIYGTIIALVEIGGGLLLIWPRTSLLGALVLLPVVGNIILTDIFFLVGALPASITVLICLLMILRPAWFRGDDAGHGHASMGHGAHRPAPTTVRSGPAETDRDTAMLDWDTAAGPVNRPSRRARS